MIRSTLLSGIFLLALIPAILRSQGQKPYPVVTEIKDGIKTVTNPDFPRDGRFVAKLTEEMSCGGEGGAEAGLLNKPAGLDVDGRGNVYVMDSGDFAIKVYDGNGRFLRAIGRQGQGPGELSDLACFKLMNDGRICVLDVMQHRIMIMSDDGRYLSGFPLAGFCNTLAVDGRDRIFIGKEAVINETGQSSKGFQKVACVTTVFRTDVSGKAFVSLNDFLGEFRVIETVDGVAMAYSSRYNIAWAARRDGKVCGGYRGDYRIEVVGDDGKKEIVFGRRFTPIENAGYTGHILDKRTLPAWRAIIEDADGSFWVELYREKKAKGCLYDVYSPEGIYIKQVSIEQSIEVLKPGQVYSLLRPEEGYPSVKRYKMELAPAGK